jgi:hypothetical protein
VKSNSLPITAALPGFNSIQLSIFWVKELRVIIPAVLGCAFCLLLSQTLPFEFQNTIGNFFYPFTCSAVFALAFGHDYMHRTLSASLAQPVERWKLFRTRIALCTAVLLPLAALNLVISDVYIRSFLSNEAVPYFPWDQMLSNALIRLFEPFLTALCLAPCLTMLSRSVLFGTIISMAAPFAFGVFVRALALKAGVEDGSRLVSVHLTASFVLLATGAILTYRRFMTQEAIETDVTIGRRGAPRPNSASQSAIRNLQCEIHSPLWELVKKEAMLQRLAAAIAVLCVAVVCLVNKDHAAMLSIFYPATIIILIGAIASAEERRMGVIPSQVAHPISFKTQWLIKVAVSYFSALLFGVILPGAALLLRTDELKTLTPTTALAAAPLICGGVLLILSITIYVSSMSQNAIRAMLTTLFIMIISVIVLGAAYNAYSQHLWRELADPVLLQAGGDQAPLLTVSDILEARTRLFVLTTFGIIPLALYFAMQNHRYLDRSGR